MATLPYAASFSPAAWLHALVQIGGGYALTSDRKLWLVVQDCPADDLTPLMAQIAGHPVRAEAVRQTIEQRHYGEAA